MQVFIVKEARKCKRYIVSYMYKLQLSKLEINEGLKEQNETYQDLQLGIYDSERCFCESTVSTQNKAQQHLLNQLGLSKIPEEREKTE